MTKVILAILAASVAGSLLASIQGWGLSTPRAVGPSIREGSTTSSTSPTGLRRNRFIGGGLHSGK